MYTSAQIHVLIIEINKTSPLLFPESAYLTLLIKKVNQLPERQSRCVCRLPESSNDRSFSDFNKNHQTVHDGQQHQKLVEIPIE
jgi:hypothetical protein